MRDSKKHMRKLPAISTASLPDIVFILLFFFMTVTVIKDTNLLVENTLPKATEAEELRRAEGVIEITVGKPLKQHYERVGEQPQIQLDGKLAHLDEVQSYVLGVLDQMPEQLKNKATVSLKVDQTVGMGLVTDIKERLREINLLKINYATIPGNLVDEL